MTATEYTPKTDAEIKQLATDTFAGQIFWATQCPPGMLWSVFMVLAFCSQEQVDELAAFNAVPYEYMDKAGPRSVNGLPCFFSMQTVSQDDYNKMVAKVKEIQKAIEAI